MKLRVFLPAIDRPVPGTPFKWILFDSRHTVLREGTSGLDEIPRADEAEAVLPASRVLFARLKLPKVSPATIRELLPFAVEDRLLADPSHIHAVAARTQKKGETIVAVIDREWLRAMLDALARAGIRPSRAWPECAVLGGGHGDWNLVWSSANGMLVDDDGVATIFDHDASGAFPLALRLGIDEATARAERPQSIRVHTQDGAALPDLAKWSAESGIAFAPGSTWQMLARDDPASDSIDLLQGEFDPRRSRSLRLPRVAIAIAAAIAALQLLFVAVDAWRLERERAELETSREALFRMAFPQAKVVVDPELQMRRNLAELKRTRGIASGDDFLGRLTQAARDGGSPARSIEYVNGKLTVK